MRSSGRARETRLPPSEGAPHAADPGGLMPARLILLFSVLSLAVSAVADGRPILFGRYPHVAQGRLVFTYHSDIWIANADGSNPLRLTANVARNTFPRLSPDGQWVAFTSNRMGNDDVWVMPSSGGEPRQLTFFSGNDTVLGWTPDGRRVLFATARGPGAWGSPLYTVSKDGGLPEPLPMDRAGDGMIRQDGSLVAFNRGSFRFTRKGYRGNNSDDVWVQDLKTRALTLLTDTDRRNVKTHVQDVNPMWGADGQVYFVSERDGTFNVWRILPAGGAATQVTSFRKDGVQFASMSPDGKTIAFENEFEMWTLAVPGGSPRKVVVDIDADNKLNLVEYLQSKNKADAFDPSPDGDAVAVEFHGEVFVVPTDPEIGEKRQVTNSPWRDQRPLFSPDGRYLAHVSDETREQEVWLYDRQAHSRRKLTSHASFKDGAAWSPDAKRLAVTGANRLLVAEVEAGTFAEVAHNPAGGHQLGQFSPDGKWLTYTRRDDQMDAEIYAFDLATKTEVNLTDSPFADTRGALTPDGRKLVFVSDRADGVVQLFVTPLERQTEDPDDPLVRERLKRQQTEKKDAKEAPAPAFRVDGDGIRRRAQQITRGESPVSSFFLSADGKLVYFTGSDERGRGLFSVTIDGKDRKRVSDGAFANLSPTRDRKKVFYAQDGEVYQMELAGEKKKTRVEFTVSVRLDRRAEWAQMFDECWRVMTHRFYDEKMHGVDWAAVRARYEPLLSYVGDNQDLYDIANEMIGELNASHMGVSGPPSREIPAQYTTQHLGFELEASGGTYRIAHIYRDGPADKEWLGLKVGDLVLAIDGRPIKPGDNFWAPLSQPLNEYVTVRVSSTPDPTSARDVRIRTVGSLGNIRYEEWVHKNREFVEKATGGRIAYVHIRSMNQPSLRRFQNEINEFWDRKGIIVDIRYNGGGNIDQELLDILERRPYEYWNNRWGSRTWGRRPRQAIAGPKVMLINWRSASDSEVTPLGFRQLGLGRIVGNTTAAAVIATGSYGLINGGSIRTPGSLVVTYDPTKPNNYGTNLENYGVDPDVWAENTPEDELKGVDRELQAAVDEVLRMLKEGRWQYDDGVR
jgi:tricorn protease